MKRIVALILTASVMWGCKLPVNSAESKEQIIAWTEEIGAMYGICPELLQAVIEKESNYNPGAKNYNGTCFGLMQINPRWQKERMARLGVSSLYDAYGNILVGAEILMEKATDGDEMRDIVYVLHSYNGGDDYAKRMEEQGRVSDYANNIIERAAELERAHGK